jgi:hypothetical protein
MKGEFDDSEGQKKMDRIANVLEEEFPESMFIIIAFTEDQAHTRYCSNLTREDATEVMEALMDEFEADKLRGDKTLN